MKKAAKKKAVAPEDKPLTPKEKRFCDEYLIDLNGARAARTAGYAKNSAKIAACKLLTKVNLQKYIQSNADKRMAKLDVTAESVLAELAKLGFSNMEDFTTPGKRGQLKLDCSELSRDQMAAIQEISYDQYGQMKLKLSDKKASLDLLGRYHKLFTDKVEHSGSINLAGLTDDELKEIANA